MGVISKHSTSILGRLLSRSCGEYYLSCYDTMTKQETAQKKQKDCKDETIDFLEETRNIVDR
jgi:hypothetical protein